MPWSFDIPPIFTKIAIYGALSQIWARILRRQQVCGRKKRLLNLQQNWALIDVNSDGSCTVYFISDCSGVFDSLRFPSEDEAKEALKHNRFHRYADDIGAQEFLVVPKSPFEEKQHPNGPIYSSGRFCM